MIIILKKKKIAFRDKTLRAINLSKGRKFNVELLQRHGVTNTNSMYVTMCELFAKEIPEPYGSDWK